MITQHCEAESMLPLLPTLWSFSTFRANKVVCSAHASCFVGCVGHMQRSLRRGPVLRWTFWSIQERICMSAYCTSCLSWPLPQHRYLANKALAQTVVHMLQVTTQSTALYLMPQLPTCSLPIFTWLKTVATRRCPCVRHCCIASHQLFG